MDIVYPAPLAGRCPCVKWCQWFRALMNQVVYPTSWPASFRRVAALPPLAAAAALRDAAVQASDESPSILGAIVEALGELSSRGYVRDWTLERHTTEESGWGTLVGGCMDRLRSLHARVCGTRLVTLRHQTRSYAAAGIIAVHLHPHVQRMAAAQLGFVTAEVFDSALLLCGSGGPATREAAARAIARAPHPLLWSHLATFLRDPDDQVREAACASLGQLCNVGVTGRGRLQLIDICYAIGASASARPGVQRAAALGLFSLGTPPPEATRLDPRSNEASALVGVLQSTLRFGAGSLLGPCALRWMVDGRFATASCDRLSKVEDVVARGRLLESLHLLLRPKRAELTSRIELNAHLRTLRGKPAKLYIGKRGLLPPSGIGGQLSMGQKLGLIKFASKLPAPAREQFLLPALCDSCNLVRLAAVAHSPARLAADFAFDAHPGVAAAAAWRVMNSGLPRMAASVRNNAPHHQATPPVAQHLARSPHATVRALTRSRSSSLRGAARLLSLGGVQESAQSTEVARALLQVILNNNSGPDERATAASKLRMTMRARVSGAEELSEQAAACLRFCIERADDPRVVANLVEALVPLGVSNRPSTMAAEKPPPGQGLLPLLVELKSLGYHQRIRANAVRSLARFNAPLALDGLRTMLCDPRPPHRLSAAWLAARSALLWRECGQPGKPQVHALLDLAGAFSECKQHLAHLARHDQNSAPLRLQSPQAFDDGDPDLTQRIRARAAHALCLWSALEGRVAGSAKLTLAGGEDILAGHGVESDSPDLPAVILSAA